MLEHPWLACDDSPILSEVSVKLDSAAKGFENFYNANKF